MCNHQNRNITYLCRSQLVALVAFRGPWPFAVFWGSQLPRIPRMADSFEDPSIHAIKFERLVESSAAR